MGIGLRPEDGFGFTADLRVELPGLDRAEAERLARTAHEIWPYSKATRNDPDLGQTVARRRCRISPPPGGGQRSSRWRPPIAAATQEMNAPISMDRKV